jgi:hypothetical protein
MSIPPPEGNLPDELVRAYRRANATDRSRPGQHVRATILARARQLVGAGGVATEHAVASVPPAAIDSQWKWKAAASLAAVSLTGLLALQTFRTVPHAPTLANTAPTADKPQPVAEGPSAPSTSGAGSTPVSAPAASQAPRDQGRRSYSNAAKSRSGDAPIVPMDSAAAPQAASQEVAPPAPAARDAARNEAPVARVQSSISALATRAASPAPDPWRDKAIAAVRATFPELFNGSAMTGTVRIALVLNSDGTVYKTVLEEPGTAGQIDAAAQLSQALGIGPDELERPADAVTLNKTPDQQNAIVVAFGVRRNTLGTTDGAR